MWLLSAIACTSALDLPGDPAARGVPVGVTTVESGGVTIEVWYPATAAAAGETEVVSYDAWVPAAFVDAVGPVSLPTVTVSAARDASVRPGGRYPIVVFSHGFGGMRTQSVDWATHLASRGYVVVAPDHPGRTLADALPCVFAPPLEGCDMGGFLGEDVAPPHVAAATDWIVAEARDFHADPDRIGLAGHSAGGATVGRVGNEDERFSALLSMANGPGVTRDVPTLVAEGTCDGVVTSTRIEEDEAGAPDARLVRVLDAGHLVFSDMCALDLADLGETVLGGRDDLNDYVYAGLVDLGTDGCPGRAPDAGLPRCGEAYLPLDRGQEIVRGFSTLFFDSALKGEGDGVDALAYAEAELR